MILQNYYYIGCLSITKNIVCLILQEVYYIYKMHKSKLILLYKSLNYSEKSLFKKWLKSPAHNKHTDVIQLFDCIASKKLLTKRTVEKKVLFKSIYPKESFNDLRLRHLMTIGVQVLENFVCFL
ncbi:MAG: hypothetical protein ACI976_001101, partial [Aureispira sp.]